MRKAKGNAGKAKKNMILQMIGLTRSSSQEVADGYGPSIQKSELLADAKNHGYRIDSLRDIVEPATIDLEETKPKQPVYWPLTNIKEGLRI